MFPLLTIVALPAELVLRKLRLPVPALVIPALPAELALAKAIAPELVMAAVPAVVVLKKLVEPVSVIAVIALVSALTNCRSALLVTMPAIAAMCVPSPSISLPA